MKKMIFSRWKMRLGFKQKKLSNWNKGNFRMAQQNPLSLFLINPRVNLDPHLTRKYTRARAPPHHQTSIARIMYIRVFWFMLQPGLQICFQNTYANVIFGEKIKISNDWKWKD